MIAHKIQLVIIDLVDFIGKICEVLSKIIYGLFQAIVFIIRVIGYIIGILFMAIYMIMSIIGPIIMIIYGIVSFIFWVVILGKVYNKLGSSNINRNGGMPYYDKDNK